MENLKIIQSYLSVSSNKEYSEENLRKMISELQKKIRTNNYSGKDGAKVYEIKEKTFEFPINVPSEKVKTKWQKFADQKGIKKKKKSRKEFCEETQQWEFKYGSKSIQNQKLRSGLIDGEKSINQLIKEKKERIDKNKKNMIKNKKNAEKK
ncbi:hypothetical protein NUSPORA_01795 [Nucleospora cyclopteri]